jgi:hypothetical protein
MATMWAKQHGGMQTTEVSRSIYLKQGGAPSGRRADFNSLAPLTMCAAPAPALNRLESGFKKKLRVISARVAAFQCPIKACIS